MAIITKDDILAYLNIAITGATTAQAAIATQVANGVSQAIASYCGRAFESTDYTDELDGSGREILILREYPVISITSVQYTDFNGIESTLETTDYAIYKEKGELKLKAAAEHGAIWIKGDLNYEVKYKAGYASIPADVILAALTWGAILFQRAEHKLHAIASKSFGDENITYRFDKIPTDVEALLAPYVRSSYA